MEYVNVTEKELHNTIYKNTNLAVDKDLDAIFEFFDYIWQHNKNTISIYIKSPTVWSITCDIISTNKELKKKVVFTIIRNCISPKFLVLYSAEDAGGGYVIRGEYVFTGKDSRPHSLYEYLFQTTPTNKLNSKHIKPWEFEKNHEGQYYNLQRENLFVDNDGKPIINFFGRQTRGHPSVEMKTLKGWEPNEEVAKLIEAAPDLYNSVIDFMAWFRDDDSDPNDFYFHLDKMKYAVDKATPKNETQ